MSPAVAAAVYFDRELAANPEPLVALVETLTSAGSAFRQWHIPLKPKGPPPSAYDLKKLVALVTKGTAYSVGLETGPATRDVDALFVRAGTASLSNHPKRCTLTKCQYEAFVALGANRVEAVEAVIAFADAVAVRAGAIFVADSFAYAMASATCSGGSTLTKAQIDRINDGLYWQPHWGDVIRGPAWGTFLGAPHVDKLGGIARIERESGCARVIALSSGGAYLQTTPEPSDAVPEALERFLEPVRHL